MHADECSVFLHVVYSQVHAVLQVSLGTQRYSLFGYIADMLVKDTHIVVWICTCILRIQMQNKSACKCYVLYEITIMCMKNHVLFEQVKYKNYCGFTIVQ